MLDFEKLAAAMGELDEDTMTELLNAVMTEGGAEAEKAMEACQKGMDTVGKLFEEGEYYVADLIYAGELMTTAVDILKDALVVGESTAAKTKMVICTVKNDLHDIGKNIVRIMFEGSGIEVIDLGVDASAEDFIATAKAEGCNVIACSSLLTTSMNEMARVVELAKAEGIRDGLLIMIGGAPITQEFCERIGADVYTADAASCARTAVELLTK